MEKRFREKILWELKKVPSQYDKIVRGEVPFFRFREILSEWNWGGIFGSWQRKWHLRWWKSFSLTILSYLQWKIKWQIGLIWKSFAGWKMRERPRYQSTFRWLTTKKRIVKGNWFSPWQLKVERCLSHSEKLYLDCWNLEFQKFTKDHKGGITHTQ
jgi:hypothetical protein